MEGPRPGTLRYQDDEGEWHYASPRDALYSTVTMCATEYWDGERWALIWEDGLPPESVG